MKKHKVAVGHIIEVKEVGACVVEYHLVSGNYFVRGPKGNRFVATVK